MSKDQFTGTATQPQCNRKFCQFNKDQYCTCIIYIKLRDCLHINGVNFQVAFDSNHSQVFYLPPYWPTSREALMVIMNSVNLYQ